MASMEDVLAEARATCERALVNVSFPVPTQTTTLGKLKTVSQNLAHVLRGHPYVEVHTLRSSLENRLFAPHAFASQRQYDPRKVPSPLVFLRISTHFTATRGIPLSSILL